MIIEVEMLAFGKPGEIREVEVPLTENASVDEVLEAAFHYGQNDFQPKNHPSVSVGDVVRVGKDRYRCCPIGWEKI